MSVGESATMPPGESLAVLAGTVVGCGCDCFTVVGQLCWNWASSEFSVLSEYLGLLVGHLLDMGMIWVGLWIVFCIICFWGEGAISILYL